MRPLWFRLSFLAAAISAAGSIVLGVLFVVVSAARGHEVSAAAVVQISLVLLVTCVALWRMVRPADRQVAVRFAAGSDQNPG